MEMRNHEGYPDPTAGKAIRRAGRVKQQGRASRNVIPLTYPIREAESFSAAVAALRLRGKESPFCPLL